MAATLDSSVLPAEEAPPPVSRMAVAALALVGLLLSAYLTLFKLGYVGTLECAVGGCELVQGSEYAYFLGLPVAAWGVGGYAVLLAIALYGLQPRGADARWVALSLTALSAVGVLFSAYLTYLEAAVIRAWCQWCVGSAVIITLIFLFSLPGLRRAR